MSEVSGTNSAAESPGSAVSVPDVSEADVADTAEQSETVDEVETRTPRTSAIEVDDYDADEQTRTVDYDPDEYR